MSETLPAVDWAAPHEDPLTQLERQVVRGSHFTQAAMDELVARLSRAEAYITELVGILRAHGVLPGEDEGAQAEADEGAQAVDAASGSAGPALIPEDEWSSTQAAVRWPGIAFRVDPEGPQRQVREVNCAERLPICHAVCCKLNFALTPPEVEAGTVKWDLGFPYLIRHEANGYCTHNDMATGRCAVYADRPEVCRRYSCANDPRIWTDFDNMILNEAWIRENLTNQNRILVRTCLPIMEVNGTPTAATG